MRVVSIGDLVTDYYYKNGVLLGINGGMSSHNIIANLSKMGIETSVFGVCGNDVAGDVAVRSLKDLKVDTSNIKIIDNINTRCFHVSYFNEGKTLKFTSKKRCPFCNEKRWYDDSLIDVNEILDKIKPDDILVFDNLNSKNQEIIDKSTNKKIVDLGQYFEFENLSKDDIINKIKGKFEIINFNERVTKYLIKIFSLKNELDVYKLFNPKLITITKGEKGATFIHDNITYDFKLENKSVPVDSTGAGDAFISSIIRYWIKDELIFNPKKFSKWYLNSTKLTYKVVQKMGARGHLKSLYKIKSIDDICTCKNFSIVIRKQIKRCSININNLETRIINAIKSNAVKRIDNIGFNKSGNYIFIGTGGSFASAYFSSIIINNLYGSNTYAMYPRDIVYRNNKKIDKVIMITYSGTTNDILESTKNFPNSSKYIITKGEQQKIVMKTNIIKNNIISYRTGSNKTKERGFLSFEGAVVPAAIFLKYYYIKTKKTFDIETFVKTSIKYWNDFFKEQFKNKNIINMFLVGNTINIFKGDYTNSASYDIESKIIESGILNCVVHEKKNFSHGRFINYENLNNKNSIYFKQKTTSKYEEKLLEYLAKDNILILESRYDGLLCEFDLLIASQLLIYYISKVLDIDVSKPKYSEDAMKIYFYKGEL